MAYAKPTPANLKTRYPAFASVDDPTVQYWLTDAERFVDETWFEKDYAPGLMAVAAHNMALGGIGSGSGVGGLAVKGVTSFRSGSFSANIDASVAQAASKGGWGATSYGGEFEALRRRNFAGPRLVRGGC